MSLTPSECVQTLFSGRAWTSLTPAGLHCKHACVCLSVCLPAVNFKWMHLSIFWTSSCTQTTARVQHWQPEAKTAEVEAWQLTCGLYSYRPSTAGCSQWCKLLMVVEVASGKGRAWKALIQASDSAHDLSVKLSPCLCSNSSCPG